MDCIAAQFLNCDCDSQSVLMFATQPEKTVMRKEEWNDLIELEFEENLFLATKFYDKSLKMVYGDYMTPPPKEQQNRVHNFIAYWK